MNFYNDVGKGENGFIHYVFTIILTIFGYIVGYIPFYALMYYAISVDNGLGTKELEMFQKNPRFSTLNIDNNVGLFVVLLIFVFAIFALFLGVKFIHKRKITSLFNSVGKIDFKRIVWSTVFWFFLLSIAELVFYLLDPTNYSFREPNISFVFLILISFLILPIQTTFEEVFTRGYILQSVAYNTKNIYFGFIVSILVFALLHGANPETIKYGLVPMMFYYITAAVLLGLIVVFDKRVELAIGVHTATNMFGAMIVTYDSAALQTDSLFKTESIDPISLGFEIMILGIIFILVSSKKYNWRMKKAFEYLKK